MTKKVAINRKRTLLLDPKDCLEALEKVWAYCQLHDFQNSVHYSLRMIENACVKATYHQSNIQKHTTHFFK